MPRVARKAPGGQVYHVLNRSVGKMHLFGKDADFEAFQQVMIEAHRRHPIRILSYCVLSNHWHFAVWPDADGQVTAFFRWLAHTHAMRWRVAHPTVDRRVRSSVSGTVPELPGAERRTSVDRLAVHRAECCGGRVGRAGGALALERPVGGGVETGTQLESRTSCVPVSTPSPFPAPTPRHRFFRIASTVTALRGRRLDS